MKALITGGAGALGSSLTKILLGKGYEVKIMDILPIHNAHKLRPLLNQVTYYWMSCEDITASILKDVDLVIHCAAQPDRPLGISSPLYTIHKNTMELAALLNACRHVSIQKFLYPGSGTIFLGVPGEQQPITEETTPKPTNPYSASKYMDEILCDSYRICYGVPTVILRSGLVYGEGMRLDISIAQFIAKALRNQTINVYSPDTTRTPTHIEDVLKYWDAVIEKDPSEVVGQIFHSVLGKEYPMIEIARVIKDTLISQSQVLPSAYEPGEKDVATGKPGRQWTTSTKDEFLGVKPSIELPEGIKKTVPYILKKVKHG